jgi:preprotein translocase subunit SecD
MNTNLRWKVIVILALVGLAVYAIYPPDRKIKLGLDLKGGVHLVLKVQTDDALRLESETTMERLREELQKANITVKGLTLVSPSVFKVEAVPPAQDQAFRRLADTQTGTAFNRDASAGGEYTFTVKPNVATTWRAEAVQQAITTIDRRVNELGVSEAIVASHGSAGDQILVQLPGVTDVTAPRTSCRRPRCSS